MSTGSRRLASLPEAGRLRTRRGRWALLALLALAVLAETIYRVSAARDVPSDMVADQSCQSDPSTVADLTGLVEGGQQVRCQSWDIGTGVTGYSWQAPNPRAVVLFQHGWGDYAQRWVQGADHMVPRLLAAGVSVYAFDMWGSGNSPGKRGYTDVDQAVEDHLAARAELADQPLPLFVMGHSLGGLVTATSVVRDQSGVAGMILLAPALKYDVGLPLTIAARVGGFLAPTVPVPAGDEPDDLLTRDPVQQRKLRDDPKLTKKGLTFLVAAGGKKYSDANVEHYPDVTVPALVIHGTADDSTDPDGSRETVAALGSMDKTLELIPGAKHALLDDLDADRVLHSVISWIDDRTPSTGGGPRQSAPTNP